MEVCEKIPISVIASKDQCSLQDSYFSKIPFEKLQSQL